MQRQIDVVEDGRLLFIVNIGKMFHGNKALLGRLQVVHAVVRRDFPFFQGIEDAPRNEEAQGREVHKRRDDTVEGADDYDQGQHGCEVDDVRQVHDNFQDRDESAAADASCRKARKDRQAGMAFELDEGQVLDDEGTGQGAQRFTDQVAVREARFRGQDVDQGGDEADAQRLFIAWLGQADSHAVGRNRPVRRDAADARRNEVQDRTDGQHERRNRDPAELAALTVMKF